MFEKVPAPKNDPRLLAPTRIKSLGGFCVRGREIQCGEEITVEYFIARDMVALCKAELLERSET